MSNAFVLCCKYTQKNMVKMRERGVYDERKNGVGLKSDKNA